MGAFPDEQMRTLPKEAGGVTRQWPGRAWAGVGRDLTLCGVGLLFFRTATCHFVRLLFSPLPSSSLLFSSWAAVQAVGCAHSPYISVEAVQNRHARAHGWDEQFNIQTHKSITGWWLCGKVDDGMYSS